MPDSRENQGFEPTAKETEVRSPSGADTQPEAGTITPEKARKFNSEVFRKKVELDFKDKPFTARQVLESLGLDSKLTEMKKKASVVLQDMIKKGTLKKAIFTRKDDSRIPVDSYLVLFCFDKIPDITNLQIDNYIEIDPKKLVAKPEKKFIPTYKIKKTFDSEYQKAFKKISEAIHDKHPNWRLSPSAETSSQLTLSELRVKLSLDVKYADQVINKLVKDGVIIIGRPTELQSKVRLIKHQNRRVQNSGLYSINLKSPDIQKLIGS